MIKLYPPDVSDRSRSTSLVKLPAITPPKKKSPPSSSDRSAGTAPGSSKPVAVAAADVVSTADWVA